ncbi:AT-hook motif nuclear-localized protein [Heracleum sosnowskyi]|uniref:AT-hook motif nuclear-localized protein n=1 Tax=Heracleum sosnowskyi TaxID=360622 RepID=A0AAD8J9J9_9APIA|nr:AT-hook motif nuclear-localized protein [Heracleum sosnowskyi]
MEEKCSSESVSLDINSATDSPPFVNDVNAATDVAPPPVASPQPLSVNVGFATGSENGELVKKKRGRPRKYDADGNLRAPAVSPQPVLSASPTGFSISHSDCSLNRSRGRGRPPGSGNWQLLASLGELFSDTAGRDFTPHVINVYPGEDVASKILSLFQNGDRGICVLSANGAVSSVTICQPSSSGGILTFEGRFEILSLTGSFTVSENGGLKRRTGRLSVSLAGPDGRVIGGGIAGTLIAANPIQCVVGSFISDAYRMHKRKQQYEATVSPVQGNLDVAATRPNLQASAETNVSQFVPSNFEEQNHVEADDNINIVSPFHADWNGSEEPEEQKPYPDINMSAPDE